MDNTDKEKASFKPPSSFIQASLARQARIKQMQQERDAVQLSPLVPSSSSSKQDPVFSPAPTQTPNKKSKGHLRHAKTMRHSPPQLKPLERTPSLPDNVFDDSHAHFSKSSSSGSFSSPSKAVLEVEKLRKNREERRQKQNEIRKMRDALDDVDQKTLYYRQVIESFRNEFFDKRKELEAKLQKQGSASIRRQPRIKVCIRKRPMSTKELSERYFDTITTVTESYPYAYIYLHEPRLRVDMSQEVNTHRFIFDHVFDEQASNRAVYQSTVKPLVEGFLEGRNVNLFAYGQTGSGKTYTIFGGSATGGGNGNEVKGMYEYLCQDLFSQIFQRNQNSSSDSLVSESHLELYICFYELYRGKVYDLLANRNRVQLLEDAKGNIQLQGHTQVHISNFQQMRDILESGLSSRSTGSTGANAHSSRSHGIIQLTLYTTQNQDATRQSSGNTKKHYAKFLLIDLAGSERGDERAHVDRETRLEGAEINKSLLALKECIRALYSTTSNQGGSTSEKHIPFRGSKLTQILKESLVGRKTQTVMMAMLSPSSHCTDHTLNTLRYADRMKELRRLEPQSPTGEVTSPSEEQVDTPDFDVQLVDADPNEAVDGAIDEEKQGHDSNVNMNVDDPDLGEENEDDQEMTVGSPSRQGLKRTSRPSTSSSLKANDFQDDLNFKDDILSFHYQLIPHSAKLATLERDLLRSLEDEEDTDEDKIRYYLQGMNEIVKQRLDMWTQYQSRLEAFAERVHCDLREDE